MGTGGQNRATKDAAIHDGVRPHGAITNTAPLRSSDDRLVRVFISSTFRDFGDGRDLLVRQVFPELRRRCRERDVTLVDVDLRWGITEAEAEQGKVLPICLAEIERSRPCFIGLLGERYGWVPAIGHFAPDLVAREPWLAEHAGGRSVTELEVLHGVLNNPVMAGFARFYFRDAAWTATRGAGHATESPEHATKLSDLKSRIRGSGFPVIEGYDSPAQLAHLVEQDLWQFIEARYPLEEVPDAESREHRRHQRYGAARLGLYLGGEAYLGALDNALIGNCHTVLVTGPSGSGKSALLANWLAHVRMTTPSMNVFVHHLGATTDSGDPAHLVRRLILWLSHLIGREPELPADVEALYHELPIWLARATAAGQCLLVLDALDKLANGRDLRWLPMLVPKGITLVVSCLDGDVMDAAARRIDWDERIEVEPLPAPQQLEVVRCYLEPFRKSLTSEQESRVVCHPLAGNPLFLRTLLEELRVFGVHEQLDGRLHRLTDSRTIDELYQQVLERVEQDTNVDHVRESLVAIWASRAGLAQDELLAIARLAPAQWAAVQLAINELLIESGGRLIFAHDYLRQAVEKRYLRTTDVQAAAHRTLAYWFAAQPAHPRTSREVPWQWRRAEDRDPLKASLIDRDLFLNARADNDTDWISYWAWLGDDAAVVYEAAWPAWASEEMDSPSIAWVLADFLRELGSTGTFTEDLYQLSIDRLQKSGDTERLARDIERRMAMVLRDRGDFAAAESMLRASLSRAQSELGVSSDSSLNCMSSLAQLLRRKGAHEEAVRIARQAVVACEARPVPQDRIAAACLGNLATALYSAIADDADAAECESITRRALQASRQAFGEFSREVDIARANLANVLADTGNSFEAEQLHRASLLTRQEMLGAHHPDTLLATVNLGCVISESGRGNEAIDFIAPALERARAVLGEFHPSVIAYTEHLADAYTSCGDTATAASLLRESLRLATKAYGDEDERTARMRYNLLLALEKGGEWLEVNDVASQLWGDVRRLHGATAPIACDVAGRLSQGLQSTGQNAAAAEVLFQVLDFFAETDLSEERAIPTVMEVADNLTAILAALGRAEESRKVLEWVAACAGTCNGINHEVSLACVARLGWHLVHNGEFAEGWELLKNVLGAIEESAGPEHPRAVGLVIDMVDVLTAAELHDMALESVREYAGKSLECAQLLATKIAECELRRDEAM